MVKSTAGDGDGVPVDTSLFWDTTTPLAGLHSAGHVSLPAAEASVPGDGAAVWLDPAGADAHNMPRYKSTPAVGTLEDALQQASSAGTSYAAEMRPATNQVRRNYQTTTVDDCNAYLI